MKRWLLLENSAALANSGWLPPPEVAPELAPLREEHLRLLAVVEQEGQKLRKLEQRRENADAERTEAMKAAFLTGQEPDGKRQKREETQLDRDIQEALLRVEAATDALHTFLVEALGELEMRAPQMYEQLSSRRAEAEAKRAQAQRLLAEADAVVGETDRMRAWLDRESGKSALGHYPFVDMGVPDPANLDLDTAVAAVS